MTVKEYIIEKNKILEKYTGLILVPEEQIIDTLKPKELSMDSDKSACPYCLEFNTDVEYNCRCKGCPMKEQNNGCLDYGDDYEQNVRVSDTYEDIGSIINKEKEWYGEIEQLIEKFNEQFKDKTVTTLDKELLWGK